MKVSVQESRVPGRGLLSRMGAAAINSEDSEELRLRKSLLLFASGLMNVAAVIWLLIYWWMGLNLPTSIPLAYQAASVIVIAIYLRTRNFEFFRVAQLSLFLGIEQKEIGQMAKWQAEWNAMKQTMKTDTPQHDASTGHREGDAHPKKP